MKFNKITESDLIHVGYCRKLRPKYIRLFHLGELAAAIQNDISTANDKLDSDECRQYLNHSFFKQ